MKTTAYIIGGPRDGSLHSMPSSGLREGFQVRFGYADGRPEEWYHLTHRLKNGHCVALYLGERPAPSRALPTI
ncbi:MAG: hypothetical protein JWM76_4384 [Pseudonocardiales bacterium]|nr:hypothetical protein [Pseudonocardiales bacterium]